MTRPQIPAPLRTVIAGTVCLAILGGMLVVHAWPLWTGRDVLMAATVVKTGTSLPGQYLRLSTPADVLMVGASAQNASAEGTAVRSIEPWISVNSKAKPSQMDRRLFGRFVYVQLAGQANGEYAPVSVSLQPVNGATNLRGVVTRGLFSGELHVQYGIDAFYMREGHPEAVEKASRDQRHIQLQVAITKSGRARIRNLFVDGAPVQ